MLQYDNTVILFVVVHQIVHMCHVERSTISRSNNRRLIFIINNNNCQIVRTRASSRSDKIILTIRVVSYRFLGSWRPSSRSTPRKWVYLVGWIQSLAAFSRPRTRRWSR